MAFQPCPGIASVTISANSGAGSDIFQNVLHFRKNDLSNWSSSEIANLANEMDTWIGTTEGTDALRTHLASAITIDGITARDLSVDGGPEYVKSVSHAGLDSGGPLSSGLSFAFTLRTGLSGRNFRGRIYAFGLTAAWNGSNADNVNATVADDVVAGWTNLIGVSAGWSPACTWAVLSRKKSGMGYPNNLRPDGIATTITEVGYSNLVIDFQRRRAPLHARHH